MLRMVVRVVMETPGLRKRQGRYGARDRINTPYRMKCARRSIGKAIATVNRTIGHSIVSVYGFHVEFILP